MSSFVDGLHGAAEPWDRRKKCVGIWSQEHNEKASILQRLIYLSAGHTYVHGAAQKCIWDVGPAKCCFGCPKKHMCFPQWGKPHPGHSVSLESNNHRFTRILLLRIHISCPCHIAANKARKPGETMPVEVHLISSMGKKAGTNRVFENPRR